MAEVVAGTILPQPHVVAAVVADAARILREAGVPDAQREGRDLVASVLDVPRLWPSLHRDAALDCATRADVLAAARRRAAGAPFAYAVGRAAFRHLTLCVDERVLIPRQETEVLVDEVLATTGGRGGLVIDVGTGSGAIALALATEGRFGRVIATDVSLGALEVARRNLDRFAPELRAPVDLRHGSFLEPVRGLRARALVSNPPYLAFHEARLLPPSVRDWEPAVALFSGEGGLAATLRILREAACLLEPGGLLALELDSRRAALAAEHAVATGAYVDVTIKRDLAGRDRILLARRKTT